MLHVYFDGVREGPVGVGKTNVEELVVYSVRGGEGETTVESVEGYEGGNPNSKYVWKTDPRLSVRVGTGGRVVVGGRGYRDGPVGGYQI